MGCPVSHADDGRSWKVVIQDDPHPFLIPLSLLNLKPSELEKSKQGMAKKEVAQNPLVHYITNPVQCITQSGVGPNLPPNLGGASLVARLFHFPRAPSGIRKYFSTGSQLDVMSDLILNTLP